MNPLISNGEALDRILAHLPAIPKIHCPLTKCAGRILAEDICADRPFPPFDRAMMDGYAIRYDDIAEIDQFEIGGEALAGHPQTGLHAEIGSAIEVMTGAVVPNGADCIVPYEATERIGDTHFRLTDLEDTAKGDCIHPCGSDHKAGQTLLRAGCVLGSREIAVAATCGYTDLSVSKLPCIAIASTGDELVPVTATPAAHQIRRSNDLAIDTALARRQLHAQERTHLPDDADACLAHLRELVANNTFILISGGISMGKKDFIPETLNQLGLHCYFHGVAQRPGKPMGFWANDSCAVFALPGNPLSTLTCLHHYAIPAIEHAMGRKQGPRQQTVELTAPAIGREKICVFLPVQLLPDNQAKPSPARNSGDLSGILESDGYILIPAGTSTAETGARFAFHPWL
ncbi:molybdopterin molybdotransferase MoeA [Coraliomargarita parva]|uniref:molybdopterin molybdotransferase MoeA n=1 Tax=Coraliomargarita parva TaxID=3014050 RepID=UPI0022B2BE13|nr:molybdopterin molybdotransferase MoeA [Coraliomargarita parva]